MTPICIYSRDLDENKNLIKDDVSSDCCCSGLTTFLLLSMRSLAIFRPMARSSPVGITIDSTSERFRLLEVLKKGDIKHDLKKKVRKRRIDIGYRCMTERGDKMK